MFQKKTNTSAIDPSGFEALVIAWCLFAAPWGAYTQFAFLATLITIPVMAGVISLLMRKVFRGVNFGFSRYDVFLLLIVSWVVLSQFWTLRSDNWRNALFWTVVNIAIYVIAKHSSANRKYLLMIAAIGLLCVAVSLPMIEFRSNEWGVDLQRGQIGEVNNNYSSYAMCTALCVAGIYMCLHRPPVWLVMIFVATTIAAIYSINLLGTRGGILSVIGIVAVLLVPKSSLKVLQRTLLVLLALLAILIVTGLGEWFLSILDNASDRGDGDLAGRISTWRSARDYLSGNMMLGIGPAAFVHLVGIDPHNFLFSLLLDWGLVGTCLFIIWLVSGYSAIDLPAPLKYRLVSIVLAYALPIALSGEWIFLIQAWLVIGVMFGAAASWQPSQPTNERRWK